MNIQLKKARLSKGLTQAELAKLSKMSARNYQNIEYGLYTPKFKYCYSLSKILEKDIEELFENNS